MGGDHADGLQYLIVGIAAAMLLGGLLIALLLGRLIARRLEFGRRGTAAAGLIGAAVGLGLGALLVTATFFESTWSPPHQLALSVPRGFAPRWVVVLEDPAGPPIVWRGIDAPFHSEAAALRVPAGGVIRVRSVEELMTREVAVRWSDDADAVGFASRPAPAGVHASEVVAFERQPRGASDGIDDLPEGAALVAYIHAHGG